MIVNLPRPMRVVDAPAGSLIHMRERDDDIVSIALNPNPHDGSAQYLVLSKSGVPTYSVGAVHQGVDWECVNFGNDWIMEPVDQLPVWNFGGTFAPGTISTFDGKPVILVGRDVENRTRAGAIDLVEFHYVSGFTQLSWGYTSWSIFSDRTKIGTAKASPFFSTG